MSSHQKTNSSWMLLVAVSYCLMFQLCAQQFYPNGRYGRSETAHSITSGSREMAITFFGDGTVSCIYTGYGELYRCSRQEENHQARRIE